jgi:phage shock protein PspC (stress-responsive transcriptional regulator)
MKKTLSVNIKGMNFLIEEDAYELLGNYLERLKQSLGKQKGSQEVIEDVELRIAELCSMRLTGKKQVVEQIDIEEILETLGQPEDYADENLDDSETVNTPFEEATQATEKRLYRDQEKAKIGGVCAGIANFLNVDVVIIRAIFLIIFLFAGFGLPLYIILWIIIPKATTTIERLRMKGRPITLESVREEVEKAAGKIVNESRNFTNKFRKNNTYNERLTSIGRVLSILVGIISVGLGIAFLIGFLFLSLNHMEFIPIDSDTGSLSISEFFSLVLSNDTDIHTVYIAIMVVTFSITLFLFLLGGSIFFKLRNNWTRAALGILFATTFFGVIFCSYVGVKTGKDFSIEGEIEKSTFVIDTQQLVIVPVYEKVKGFEHYKIRSQNYIHNFRIEGNEIHTAGINIDYQESDDSLYHVSQNFVARSYSHKTALYKAKNILHEIMLVDNQLKIPTSYHFSKYDKLRGQEVHVIIEIPKGKSVVLNNQTIFLGDDKSKSKHHHRRHWEDGFLESDGTYRHWD